MDIRYNFNGDYEYKFKNCYFSIIGLKLEIIDFTQNVHITYVNLQTFFLQPSKKSMLTYIY
jgi:hypothetical protein